MDVFSVYMYGRAIELGRKNAQKPQFDYCIKGSYIYRGMMKDKSKCRLSRSMIHLLVGFVDLLAIVI